MTAIWFVCACCGKLVYHPIIRLETGQVLVCAICTGETVVNLVVKKMITGNYKTRNEK